MNRTATAYIRDYMENALQDYHSGDYDQPTWELFFQTMKNGAHDWAQDEDHTDRNFLIRIINMKDGQFKDDKRIWQSLQKEQHHA